MAGTFEIRRLRGSVIEGTTGVRAVVATARGDRVTAAGDVESPLPVLGLGHPLGVVALLAALGNRLEVADEDLAAAAAWSTAEGLQARAVRNLFARAGAGEEHLQCGPRGADHPCAPYHALLLAASRRMEAPPREYRSPEGKVQGVILDELLRMVRRLRTEVTLVTDECGLPTPCLSPTLLASLYAGLADTSQLPGPAAHGAARLMAAIRTRPDAWAEHGTLEADLYGATDGDLVVRPGECGLYGATVRSRGWGIVVAVPSGDGATARLALLVLVERLGLAPKGRAESLIEAACILRNGRGDTTGHLEPAVDLARGRG